MKPTGYILYEGPSQLDPHSAIVAILTMHSSNAKTGDMAQLWILSASEHPIDANRSGADAAICGDCPHRGNAGAGRSCYVNLGQAPAAVWKAYRSGRYPQFDLQALEQLKGRYVRLGAYGDPVALPISVVKTITHNVKGWTGYTHQWRSAHWRWRELIMASADTTADAEAAQAKGWRTFRVSATDETQQAEIVCPSVTHGVQCRDCRLCAGTSKPAKNIVIQSHGSGAVHANKREAQA